MELILFSLPVSLLAISYRVTRFLYPALVVMAAFFVSWSFMENDGGSSGHQSIRLGFDALLGIGLLLPAMAGITTLVLRRHRRVHARFGQGPLWPRWWRAALWHALGMALMGLAVILAALTAVLLD